MITQCAIYPKGYQAVVLSDGTIASVPYINVVGASLQKRMKVWLFEYADLPISRDKQESLILSQMRRVGANRALYDDLATIAASEAQTYPTAA